MMIWVCPKIGSQLFGALTRETGKPRENRRDLLPSQTSPWKHSLWHCRGDSQRYHVAPLLPAGNVDGLGCGVSCLELCRP